jgi:hypothetical protein
MTNKEIAKKWRSGTSQAACLRMPLRRVDLFAALGETAMQKQKNYMQSTCMDAMSCAPISFTSGRSKRSGSSRSLPAFLNSLDCVAFRKIKTPASLIWTLSAPEIK